MERDEAIEKARYRYFRLLFKAKLKEYNDPVKAFVEALVESANAKIRDVDAF